jgi:uncharacterized protein YdaU (DUF1376 family)
MKIRRIDFWPDEWIAGTVDLDNAERGLYITVCALIYSHGGPIPVEHLKAACRDHGHAFRRQLSRLLSTDKLSLNDGQIDNKRCAKELQKAVTRAANERQNNGKRPANDQQNDPQPAHSNGLEAYARARAIAPARADPGHNQPISPDLSVLTDKEGSGLTRTRAREAASGGGSHASPAPMTNRKRSNGDAVPQTPWAQRCRVWVESGFWIAVWGPPPSEPGCHAPDALVAEARLLRNGAGQLPAVDSGDENTIAGGSRL